MNVLHPQLLPDGVDGLELWAGVEPIQKLGQQIVGLFVGAVRPVVSAVQDEHAGDLALQLGQKFVQQHHLFGLCFRLHRRIPLVLRVRIVVEQGSVRLLRFFLRRDEHLDQQHIETHVGVDAEERHHVRRHQQQLVAGDAKIKGAKVTIHAV